ncbi:hypothetical protein GCM10023178_24300 [Actinomadura luteofluorescens]
MGHIDVSDLAYALPDGRPLLREVSFRVGQGAKAALVGPNGGGKTTLLRLIAGELTPSAGKVANTGGLGVMRQFTAEDRTVRELLLSVAPPRIRAATGALARAEAALADAPETQIAYAQAISDFTEAGGYDLEVVWDACTTLALGLPYEDVRDRPAGTLSGGEQKRLMLETLLRGPDEVLLLDEPDNYLDIPGKQWLEERLRATTKTVLLVSHDRRLLAGTADRIITVESGTVWVPRDSMVKMPSCKKEKGGTVPAQFGMLNAAFAYAGPTCTWKTLESLTGIHIDHFVQVEICVDKPVRDPRAELYLKAGKQTVKGDDALGYVRARYSLGDGSDLERIERQQKFMAAVVDKATSGSVLKDPAKTYKFLKAATKSMTTDDDLDLAGMRKLADGLKGMSAGQVRFVTVPVEGYAPDPNRVQWNEELAKPLFEAVRHDDDLPAEPAKPARPAPAPPSPGKVHVTVVDAGAKDKQVERVVNQLRRRGFAVAKKVEKAAAAPESRLVYAPAAEAQASALARDVPDALLTSETTGPPDGVRLVIGAKGLRLAPPAINRIGGGVKAGRKLCG